MSDTDPTKPDLSLVDTDWLIEELSKRSDAMLLVRERFPNDHEGEVWFDFSGGVSACIGLVIRARRRLLKSVRESDGDDQD